MKRSLRLIALLLALLTAIACLAACGGNGDGETTTTGAGDGTTASPDNQNKSTYNVEVKTAGGLALSGVTVSVYADATLADMKAFGDTNEYGKVSFQLEPSSNYAVVISEAPKGYVLADKYAFTGNTALITLTSTLIAGDISAVTKPLVAGDIMYDFTVTDPEGNKITVSELLKEKKLVMLNFWYEDCPNCLLEFPFMQSAYEQYKDDIAIIALNPIDGVAQIKSFKERYGYTFDMVSCPSYMPDVFAVSGYPTSVFIDRYGMISLIEVGAITSERPFTCAFTHFTEQNYKPMVCKSIGDLVPTVKPTYTMDTSENISAVLNKGDINVTYHPETKDDSSEYSWPFILTEKNGVQCFKASNQAVESSFAIIYADVKLEAGQAICFDYLVSSELYNDVLYVIVDGEDIYQISGVSTPEEWKACYPFVAVEAGTYELALCYLKDGDGNSGDDTVYIKDMRVLSASDISAPTYIPRYPATSKDGFAYTYADIFYNEADGYYHVGSVNGPLLLVDLLGTTDFTEEDSINNLGYDGNLVLNGHDYYTELEKYCNYASNSALSGICTVNRTLYDLLVKVDEIVGFDAADKMEWLKACKYYEAYGTNGEQLVDPIKGIALFAAYEATLGKGVPTNIFEYNRVILPRGMYAKFVPEVSGVYRITSISDGADTVEAWMFNEKGEIILTYEHDERMYEDSNNCSMVIYLKAGTPYYIDIAFWDIYTVGSIRYDIEFLGATYDHFRLASPGTFTYDMNATGDAVYDIIAGGIDVIVGADGYYYHDLGKDANGNQLYGSKIYADFSGITAIFDKPIVSGYIYDENGNIKYDPVLGTPLTVTGLIERGAFDFSRSESDDEILVYLKKFNNDVKATDDYLRNVVWGEEYDEYAALYMLEEIYDGIYHGKGQNLTALANKYAAEMIKDAAHPEIDGCVAVNEELATLLWTLMDKYTFEGVENSWLKLCYYYDYMGR